MRFASLLVLLVALMLGGGAALATRQYINAANQPAGPSREKVVVVARQPLGFGTVLTEDNIQEIAWPDTLAIEGAFSSKAELLAAGRRVVLSATARHEPILASKITGSGQRATLSTLIEDGMRAVAVRVDDIRGVAGFILPGDRVDVILTRSEGNNDNRQAFADVLLQNVKVLAIDQLSGDRQERPTVARAVTLELNTQQSQKVILAQGVGSLSLVLRQAGQATAEATRRISLADLGLAEAIEPKRNEAQEQIARLEAELAELRKAREGAETETRTEIMKKMAELEARLQGELRRKDVRSEPVIQASVTPLPVVRDTSTLVNVVRNGGKREQYNVNSESR